jgi:hemolysin activation/secretion protein
MRHRYSFLIAGAALAVLALSARAADEPEGVVRFDITRFEVTGNTLLPVPTVERILEPYTGKQRDFGDVQRALEALETEYRRLGYNVVQVALPEQELNQGVVRLQIVETKIGKVRVEGNETFDEANIRRSLPGLVEGQSPNIGKISSSLKLANENPSKKATMQLQSSQRDDAVDVLLKVADEKLWRAAANIDNSGNKNTGESQLTMQFQHANISGRDDVLSLQYTTTLEKPSQVSVYGVGFHLPLYALGDSIDLFANYSNVDSGSVLAGITSLQVSGRGTVLGGRYNQHLRRIGDYESRIAWGLDYKQFQNNVDLAGIQLGNDVTVHPFSLAYSGNLNTPDGELGFSVTALRNIPCGDKGGSADFNRVRAGAPAGYGLLRYNATYSHALPADWQMRLNFSGQHTSDVLVPGEQFGAGGANTVRGFNERDISNDVGYLASAELYTPNFCAGLQSVAAQCRAVVFYDAAQARRNDPLPGEVDKASIGSVGLGLRFSVDKYMTLQTDYGHVVDGSQTQQKGDNRFHFRIGLAY